MVIESDQVNSLIYYKGDHLANLILYPAREFKLATTSVRSPTLFHLRYGMTGRETQSWKLSV